MLCCLARNIHSEPGKGKLSSFFAARYQTTAPASAKKRERRRKKQASVDSLAKEKRGFQVNTSCCAPVCTKQCKMLKSFCKCATAVWHQVFSRKRVSVSRCSHDIRKRCMDLGRCVTLCTLCTDCIVSNCCITHVAPCYFLLRYKLPN